MKQQVYVPLDTFRVKMIGFCGMSQTIASELTYRDALKRAGAYARKRHARGYTVASVIAADPVEQNTVEYELCAPDDAAMVPDDAGYLRVEQEYVRGRECWMCGSAVRVDEPCCETDEQDEYSEQFN